MDWIAWDDTLNTGHPGMDADHKELAGLFDLLRDAVEGGKGKAACLQVLDKIIGHAQAHFDRERALMAQHRYPKADQHGAEHTMLIHQAQALKLGVECDFAASTTELAGFPEVWLAFHILFSDKELAEFLARAHAHHPDAR